MTIQETLIDLIIHFPKNKYALLSKLADELDDRMLREIAEADYGYGADKCFEKLKYIQVTKKMPETIDTQLNEVVALSRWTEAITKEEHIIRSFCCVFLLIEETMEGTFAHSMGMPKGSIAVLMDSITFLGEDYYELVAQFFNWRIFHEYQLEKDGFDEDMEPYTLDELYIDNLFIANWLYCLVLQKTEQEKMIPIVDWLLIEGSLFSDIYKLTLPKENSESVVPQRWSEIQHYVLSFVNQHYKNKEVYHKLLIFINAMLSNDTSEIEKIIKSWG